MSNDITAVVDQLTQHESALLDDLRLLRSREKKVSEQLEQIRIAIKALKGDGKRLPSNSLSNNNRELTDQLILDVISKHAESGVKRNQLAKFSLSELLSKGTPKYGLKVRINRLVASFLSSTASVEVAENTPASSA